MANDTLYPGALDTFPNDAADGKRPVERVEKAVKALEAKLGVTGSTATGTLDETRSRVAVLEREVVTTAAPFRAKCDAVTVSDLVSNGTTIVTSASAPFTSTGVDAGKVASVRRGSTGVTTTIVSVQSATQATLAATVPTGTGGILTFGTDDTVAIQAAANAVPEGGTLVQPAPSMITAEIVANKSMTVRGTGVAEVTADIVSSTFGSGPSLAPYLRGSLFIQATSGANGIRIPGTGVNVHCRDFGVVFAPAIMFANTGHGIYAVPTATYGPGGHQNGLFNPRWDNLVVFGHDGNHYAYYLLNSNLGTFTHLRGHGGGGLFLESDSHGAGYGNAVYVHPFFRVLAGGSAHGFALKCRDIDPLQPSLNLITFVRPQVNILSSPVPPAFSGLGITAPTVAQYTWRHIALDTRYPGSIDIIDPDLEGDGVNAYPCDFGGMYSGTVVRNGGTIAVPPSNGYSTENRSNPGVPMQPTVVAGPGAGTGADCRVLEGDDQSGVMLLQAGTSPGAAQTVVATVTCPSMPPSGIKAVLVQGWGYSAGYVKWYVDDIADDSKSFTIRAWDGVLTAGYAYQVLFHVIPRATPNNTI